MCRCHLHQQKTLDDFVIKSSRRLFCILGVRFFEVDSETWNKGKDFEVARDAFCFRATTNDHVEKSMAVMQQMT